MRTGLRTIAVLALAASVTACQLTDELASQQPAPTGAAATASAATSVAQRSASTATETAQEVTTSPEAVASAGTTPNTPVPPQPTAYAAGAPGVTDQGIETSGDINLRQFSDAVPGCVLNALLMSPLVTYDLSAPNGGSILLYFNRGQQGPATMLVQRVALNAGTMSTRNLNGESSDQPVSDDQYRYIGVFSCNSSAGTATLERNLISAAP